MTTPNRRSDSLVGLFSTPKPLREALAAHEVFACLGFHVGDVGVGIREERLSLR